MGRQEIYLKYLDSRDLNAPHAKVKPLTFDWKAVYLPFTS